MRHEIANTLVEEATRLDVRTSVREVGCEKMETVLMHDLILPTEKDVDHRDRNPLNNRRLNLRLATRSQNLANTRSRSGSSRYKGVCFSRREQKFRAYIVVNYKQIHLGYFDSDLDAARVYNEAAREHFGAFALLNDVTHH